MQILTTKILDEERRQREKAENLIRSEQIRREESVYSAEARL